MAIINETKKEILVKIVYYGSGRCGKTTNIEYIQSKYKSQMGSKMAIINTMNDNTLFFDFLPLDIGSIKEYRVKLQLYTIPGQVKYGATRRLVLKGVDGIVFVADSMELRRDKNIAALKSLEENLKSYDKDIKSTPIVFQYNKRDLNNEGFAVLPVEALENDLNGTLKAPYFEASAVIGVNVVETLKKIISLTIPCVKKELNLN